MGITAYHLTIDIEREARRGIVASPTYYRLRRAQYFIAPPHVCAGVLGSRDKPCQRCRGTRIVKRKSPFVEMDVLHEVFPYTKHVLTLVDVEILSVEGVLEYAAAGKPG